MTKTFCDMCGNTISNNQMGGLMRNVDQFPVNFAGPNQIIQKKLTQEVWDLCSECQKSMWEIAEEKKAELLKLRGLINPKI